MKQTMSVSQSEGSSFLKTFLLLSSIFLIAVVAVLFPTAAEPNYIITGETVSATAEGKGVIAQTPHTLASFTNQPEITFVSSFASAQTLDFAFGFDTETIRPTSVLYKNPQTVQQTKSFTCSPPFWHNYSAQQKRFWCWSNSQRTTVDERNQTQEETHAVLVFEHSYESIDPATNTITWQENVTTIWSDISSTFATDSYTYHGKDAWYIIQNITVQPGETKTIKPTITIAPSTGRSEGKYEICMKPSGLTIQQAVILGSFFCLDPWWNSSWNRCRNLTITDPLTPDIERRNGNDPIFLNITGLTFSNAGNEIRIVNAPCNQGGLEIPRHIISNSTNSTYVTFLGNVSTYSVYYDNPSAATPSYTTGMSNNQTYASWRQGYSAYFRGNASSGCTNGASSVICELSSPAGQDFTDAAAQVVSLYDGADFRPMLWELRHNSSVFSQYEASSTGWNGVMYVWANAEFGPVFSFSRASNISSSEMRLFDTRNYNVSLDEWVYRDAGTAIQVAPISGASTYDMNDTVPYSGYHSKDEGNYTLLSFLGKNSNSSWNWKSGEGYCSQGSDNSCNYWEYWSTSQQFSTYDYAFFFIKHYSGFTFNTTFYDSESLRYLNNLSVSIGDEQTTAATEAEGRAAIVQGIQNSVPGASIYTDRQVYTVNTTGSHSRGSFDAVAVSGNQTWAFNYVTAGESATNVNGILTIVNVWEKSGMSPEAITSDVGTFINDTKS